MVLLREQGQASRAPVALARVSAFASEQWETYMRVHSSVIHNCQKVETTETSISR